MGDENNQPYSESSSHGEEKISASFRAAPSERAAALQLVLTLAGFDHHGVSLRSVYG